MANESEFMLSVSASNWEWVKYGLMQRFVVIGEEGDIIEVLGLIVFSCFVRTLRLVFVNL